MISAYYGLLEKAPSASDLSGWAEMTRANRGALAVLVSQLRTSTAYADRVKSL